MAKSKLRAASSAIPPPLRFEVGSEEVAYRSIAQKLRALILSKELVPGTRLPPFTQLAELWGTNYFTVQTALTPLVNEGLLVRKPRVGTVVAQNTRQIKAVGIYFGASFWSVRNSEFYQTFYVAACEHFERLGISVHLFMDSRQKDQQSTPWKPLQDAIDRSEVSAVIGSMLTAAEVEWLLKLTLPVCLLGAAVAGESSIGVGSSNGNDGFIESSLRRLKERKCGSVGLIGGEGVPEFAEFKKMAAEMRLVTRPEWCRRKVGWTQDFDTFGFEAFCEIWDQPDQPHGLIVHPDSIARGVIMAVLQRGVKVPEHLHLVMHCNDEVHFHCPLTADWQVLSIAEVVRAAWRHLQRQAEGNGPKRIDVPLTLRPPTAKTPPLLRR